jgi:hypothetical protein
MPDSQTASAQDTPGLEKHASQNTSAARWSEDVLGLL